MNRHLKDKGYVKQNFVDKKVSIIIQSCQILNEQDSFDQIDYDIEQQISYQGENRIKNNQNQRFNHESTASLKAIEKTPRDQLSQQQKDAIQATLAQKFITLGYGYIINMKALKKRYQIVIESAYYSSIMSGIARKTFKTIQHFLKVDCKNQSIKPIKKYQAALLRSPILQCRKWLMETEFNTLCKFIMRTYGFKKVFITQDQANKLYWKLIQSSGKGHDILHQYKKTNGRKKEIDNIDPLQVQVEIQLINGEIKFDKFRENITGLRLKYQIAKFICQELSPCDMSLYYGDIKIQNHVHLSELNIPKQQIIKITQRKLQVKDYQEDYLKIYANEEDLDTYESGVVEMICGCRKGQEAMTIILKVIVKQLKSTIVCPKHPNIEWQLRICKKIARLTMSQRIQIQSGLSLNNIRNNKTICQCPNQKCRQSIMIEDQALLRIGCPKCHKDFCLKQFIAMWKYLIQKEINKILANCPEKNMSLLVVNVSKNFKVPNLRACVFCKSLIQHVEACKHMTCSVCQNKFCFVCLKKYQNGWPCGSYKQYCKSIHPRQKF